MRLGFVTLLLALVWGMPAMADSGATELTVENAYIRGLPPGQKNTAAFFKVINNSDHDIVIRAGQSTAAKTLEIQSHEHRDGMMAMRMQSHVTVPAGESLDFAPGGLHLMLLDLSRLLVDGDELSFSLFLSREGGGQSQQLEITAPVISVLKMNHNRQQNHGEH